MANTNDEQLLENMLRIRGEYMRGELEEHYVGLIQNGNPELFRKWGVMKLRLKLKLQQFRKEISDILRAGLAKARGCKRYRPGKIKSTNKKEYKSFRRLEIRYARAGCNVLIEFAALVAEIKPLIGGCIGI
jgi:hypothetical protein